MSGHAVFLGAGLCLLLAVVLPRALESRAVSAPMVLVAIGMLVGLAPIPEDLSIDPVADRLLVEHVTEITVLVALMGVGLAIDRPLRLRSVRSWGTWSATWRLLAVAMPLCIGAVALLGWWVAGLAPAAALLLGAALAPTDPVLASDVQVGGPAPAETLESFERGLADESLERGEVDEVRFALTAEAGLNDGLAFPFVYLAILVAAGGFGLSEGLTWVGWYAVGRVVIGVAVGIAVGALLARVAFRSRRPSLRLAEQGEPLLALASLLTAYGAAELVGGYGFLAVVACAMSMRSAERAHDYHRSMHEVVERLERLMTLVVLLLLGVATTRGLLDDLTWGGAAVALVLLLVVRPLSAQLALAVWPRHRDRVGGLDRRQRRAVAFFGVRGVGTIYYLAYATGHEEFTDVPLLWSIATFTIVGSVLLHGVLAGPWLARLDRDRETRSAEQPLRSVA